MSEINSFKHELNEQQNKAVEHKEGALMVIAGAGSGKTRVITKRIAHLIIDHNVDPSSIVALTFTNKAAQEMKERLTSVIGHFTKQPFIGTFHSYCLFLLRSNPQMVPFSSFSILDADDQKALLKKILKRHNLEKQLPLPLVQHHISMMKNRLSFENDESFTQPLLKEVYLAYEQEKNNEHNLDFDDLLVYTLRAFQQTEVFRTIFQQRVRHILVDEYQDTSSVQHELLRCMAGVPLAVDSLSAVGDEDQSIYSWRGALVTNMLSFQKDFAPVTLVKIEQNYRSVQPILQAANGVIQHNTVRNPKILWSERKAERRVLFASCQSGYQEAELIANFLTSVSKKVPLHEVAILYRTHFQSRVIEEVLMQHRIAYHIVGGIRFYERKEIKDLLAYMKLVVNPYDRTSFFRIINTPLRGLGEKFEEECYHAWLEQPLLDFRQIIEYLITTDKLKGAKREAVKDFCTIFDDLVPSQTARYTAERLLERTGYFSFLRSTLEPKEAETKSENIREFLVASELFEHKRQYEGKPHDLEQFLYEIALMQEMMEQDDDKSDHVQLMTLHAVKGLEFTVVCIVGLEEGMLPSTRSLHVQESLEEERRLLYVGMTRAKEHLILTNAAYRSMYGQMSDCISSRFVAELPAHVVYKLDCTDLSLYQATRLVEEWYDGVSRAFTGVKTFGAQQSTPRFPRSSSQASPDPVMPERGATVPEGSVWKRNQSVVHATFGTGVVQEVQKKDAVSFYVTVAFRSGTKKVLSTFLKRLP